ncbi:MAG: acyl carrier protein [Verrucomicrobiaceae bacterium]
MGLDAVELVMAFEETFQVSISDAEAEKLMTPRHVVDLIVSKLGLQDGPQSLSWSDQFTARLREALLIQGVTDDLITPDQPLEAIFPIRATRREDWQHLKECLQASRWPRLRWFGLSADFPPALPTLRHLAEWLAWESLPQLTPEKLRSLTRGDVSYLVKGIILNQLGLPESEYDEGKTFVGELGVD